MAVAAATSYSVTDLGTLPGGTQSVAHGLNAVGWAVGTADTAAGDLHAFLSAGGRWWIRAPSAARPAPPPASTRRAR
jgi:probable HAF family extracellular repeat protein